MIVKGQPEGGTVMSRVNKNKSSTPLCTQFSAFLKPFSVN